MDQNSLESNYAIEEYKALRAEMIRHMDSLDRNILSAITATGVAVAYGLKDSAFILLLANLIPVYFWIQHVNNRRKIAKLSSYIAVFLEGNNQLMWHRRNEIQMRRKSSPPRFYLRTFSLPYPILLIVSVLVSIWYLRKTYAPGGSLLIPGFASAAIVSFVCLIAKKTDQAFWIVLDRWTKKFESIKETENLNLRP